MPQKVSVLFVPKLHTQHFSLLSAYTTDSVLDVWEAAS